MLILRVCLVLFFSLAPMGQLAAQLTALGVLEVLRHDYEALPLSEDNYQHQQKIVTAAIKMIATTRLDLPFQRNYIPESKLNVRVEFPEVIPENTYGTYHYDQFYNHSLHGSSHNNYVHLANPHYQSFGLSNQLATLSQKTRYVEWFLRASLVKVDVDYILDKAASTPEITGSLRGRDHLKACRQLWALAEKAKQETRAYYSDIFLAFNPIHYSAFIHSNTYFNILDTKITEGGDFTDFYTKRVVQDLWASTYDTSKKSQQEERLKAEKERQDKEREEKKTA